jgi:hypothetical protein
MRNSYQRLVPSAFKPGVIFASARRPLPPGALAAKAAADAAAGFKPQRAEPTYEAMQEALQAGCEADRDAALRFAATSARPVGPVELAALLHGRVRVPPGLPRPKLFGILHNTIDRESGQIRRSLYRVSPSEWKRAVEAAYCGRQWEPLEGRGRRNHLGVIYGDLLSIEPLCWSDYADGAGQ